MPLKLIIDIGEDTAMCSIAKHGVDPVTDKEDACSDAIFKAAMEQIEKLKEGRKCTILELDKDGLHNVSELGEDGHKEPAPTNRINGKLDDFDDLFDPSEWPVEYRNLIGKAITVLANCIEIAPALEFENAEKLCESASEAFIKLVDTEVDKWPKEFCAESAKATVWKPLMGLMMKLCTSALVSGAPRDYMQAAVEKVAKKLIE
jgi:hypothetical protein